MTRATWASSARATFNALRCDLACRDVLDGADEYGPAVDLFAAMSDAAQMLDGALATSRCGIRNLGSVPASARSIADVERRHVLGHDDTPKPLRRDLGSRLELADAVELVGPEVLVLQQVRSKAAGLAQPLRFRQMIVRPTESRSRAARRLGHFALRHVLNGAHEHRSTGDVLADTRRSAQMLRAPRAVTIRNSNSTSWPAMPRSITASYACRSSGWTMSRSFRIDRFDSRSNSQMR